MGRIFFKISDRLIYFNTLKTTSKLSWKDIASCIKISSRHLTDCRNGKSSLSTQHAEKIRKLLGICLPINTVIKKDHWSNSIAGKIGAEKRYKLYGNPGTTEGRRKGGLNSVKKHKKNKTGFHVLKRIKIPRKSKKLAELIGVLLGDGSLSQWQVKIYLSSITDKEYALYLIMLIKELFETEVKLSQREKSTIELCVNSKKMVLFLNQFGIPIGNKIKQNINIPRWIYERKAWQITCIRGLFDTDGSLYIDHHRYKDKTYRHLCIAFTNYSKNILISTYDILHKLGYNPTVSTKNRVILRRKKELFRFLNEFKPSNSRNYVVIKKFLEEYRSG